MFLMEDGVIDTIIGKKSYFLDLFPPMLKYSNIFNVGVLYKSYRTSSLRDTSIPKSKVTKDDFTDFLYLSLCFPLFSFLFRTALNALHFSAG